MHRILVVEDEPDIALTCGGVVTKKYNSEGRLLLDCDVWVEDEQGRRFTPGWATVELPSREA